MNDMTPQEFVELQELREVTCGSLSVIVDFNELYADKGDDETFAILGKLKDLLT